jgi:Transglutaminase-like superfamily
LIKRISALLLFAVVCLQSARSQTVDFSAIDNYASTIEGSSVRSLTSTLCSPYHRDVEKVRAIFSWIATHISYYTRRPAYEAHASVRTRPENFLATGEEDLAEAVLQTRTAVCNGYARLFQTMCIYAGVRAELITGYASGGTGRFAGKFTTNHYWNAVYTDSAWHLIDVTWASGYSSYSGNSFIANFNPIYFYSDPVEFSRDHFPDDLSWTLDQQFRIPFEFNRSPYRQRSFIKYSFSGFFPNEGIIEAAPGDTISFSLQTRDAAADSRIFPDTIRLDSAMQSPMNAFLMPADTGALGKVKYQFIVGDRPPVFIHLLYNNDVVLRYRLKIRRTLALRESQ